MRITIEIQDLVESLRTAFPELDEAKLKAAMFDLMVRMESKGVIMTPTARPSKAAPIGKREYVETETVSGEGETEPEPELSEVSAAVVGEPSGWADVGRSRVTAKPESAFDFEGSGGGEEAPIVKGTKVTVSGPMPSAKEKKARPTRPAKKSKDPFEGLTDLEIAKRLTAQAERKAGQGGQFTDLGDVEEQGGGDLVF
jgi:hypothetical protein